MIFLREWKKFSLFCSFLMTLGNAQIPNSPSWVANERRPTSSDETEWDDIIEQLLCSAMPCESDGQLTLSIIIGQEGVGKSYVLEWMIQKRLLPNEHPVVIDIHSLRQAWTNTDALVHDNDNGLIIAELAISCALNRGYSVVVEGSTSSAQWIEGQLNKLREHYRDVKQVLIAVSCSENEPPAEESDELHISTSFLPNKSIIEYFDGVYSICALADLSLAVHLQTATIPLLVFPWDLTWSMLPDLYAMTLKTLSGSANSSDHSTTQNWKHSTFPLRLPRNPSSRLSRSLSWSTTVAKEGSKHKIHNPLQSEPIDMEINMVAKQKQCITNHDASLLTLISDFLSTISHDLQTLEEDLESKPSSQSKSSTTDQLRVCRQETLEAERTVQWPQKETQKRPRSWSSSLSSTNSSRGSGFRYSQSSISNSFSKCYQCRLEKIRHPCCPFFSNAE